MPPVDASLPVPAEVAVPAVGVPDPPHAGGAGIRLRARRGSDTKARLNKARPRQPPAVQTEPRQPHVVSRRRSAGRTEEP